MPQTNIPLQCIYLSISLWSTYSYMYEYATINTLYLIGISCFLDLLFVEKSKDIILHHVCVLCVCDYVHNNPTEKMPQINIIIHNGMSCEISNIFLITKNILKVYNHNSLHTFNDVLFVVLFFYFRIYNYTYILLNEPNINYLLTNGSFNNLIKINIGIYGFFLLNLYWANLIINKICTQIKNNYFNLDHFYNNS
jgi:hypothetical protein